jgi:hypothetical protein
MLEGHVRTVTALQQPSYPPRIPAARCTNAADDQLWTLSPNALVIPAAIDGG